MIISDMDTHIIESLARYKFLTSTQMVRLGISADKSNLHKRLVRLRNGAKPLIECVKFDGRYKAKGLEYVYFISKRGVKVLYELGYMDDQIKKPKGQVYFPKQYHHRKGCIDIQIAVYEWAENNGHLVEVYHSYFDKVGSTRGKNYRSKTAFLYDEKTNEYLVADGVALVSTTKEQELFCVELHNGTHVKRAMKQIEQYIGAMNIGSPTHAYDLKKADGTGKACKVLFACEYSNTMVSLMTEFRDSVKEVYRNYFFFGHYDMVMQDFRNSWRKCTGERASIGE